MITSRSPRYAFGFLGSVGVLFLGFSGVTAAGDAGFSSMITHDSGSSGSASANGTEMKI